MNEMSQAHNQHRHSHLCQPGGSQGYSPRGQVRRGERRSTGWIAGAFLVVLGTFCMGQATGASYMQNWWALFILLPAIGAFATAWRIFQDAGGRLTYAVRGSLLAGSILVYTTAIFLLNLSWVMLGPVVIILAGVGMLLNYALPQ